MALSEKDLACVSLFRDDFDNRFANDPRFGLVFRDDRDDLSSLCTRFTVGPKLWLELCIRPQIPQVRVGIVTDDRWASEELEDAIEETGDTMSEFVELGFDEVELDWTDPPVEHYRDQGKYFYFSTGWELERVTALERPEVREKVVRMFNGYYEAFRKAIEKAAAASD